MLKKIIQFAIAVACFTALAAPTAMANVTFTDTGHNPIGSLEFNSTNTRITTANGILACETWNLTAEGESGAVGTVSDLTGEATGVLPSEECRVLNGAGETITGGKVTSISGHATFNTGGTGTISLTVTYHVTVAPGVYGPDCLLHAVNQPFSFTTGSTTQEAVITINNAAMVGTGPNPPCAASGVFSGTFNYDGIIDD